MAVIFYKKTVFNVPALIEQNVYDRLKQAINIQPSFRIYMPAESFTGHFKRTLKTFLFAFPVFIVVLGFMLSHGVPATPLPGWWIVLIVLLLLSGFVSAIMLFGLLLEGTSYATYLHNKQQYYTAMQYAIQKSSGYPDFVRLFSASSPKQTINYEALAAQAPQTKQPATLNRILIRVFHFLDGIGWLIMLAGISWLVWKHFHEAN